MGEKVCRFEAAYARYLGVRHAVMVNSGSSANLLALSALAGEGAERPLLPGDEVITPAVTWATTVWPIAQLGLRPVLVDVDATSFNIDPQQIERAITPRTRAIMLVHLLGRPCEMDAIAEIAERHELLVIEDACEAHGAEHRGRKVGSLGDLATFSFYFSHHMTTIEGGIVVTDSDAYADAARTLRAFGWARDSAEAERHASAHPQIDPRFLFVAAGYNMRPTELQAAFGLHQLDRLDGFVEERRANAAYWTGRLAPLSPHLALPSEDAGTRHAWFAYPVAVAEGAPFAREQLVAHLEARGVETRPIMAGNIAEQPAMAAIPHRVVGELPNARSIHRSAFFFGNHQAIGEAERSAIVDYVADFVASQVLARAA
jgi:CDP-6-deoxy-D-xylo-4-hexulose-3-dehydrase